MQNLILFLNNEQADLGDDLPALSFQINNLAEVQNQQGNYSKQFKLPLTNHNRKILGFPDEIPLDNNVPYTQLTAKIVQDGFEIVQEGIAEINSIEEPFANITVLSGNVDIFDQLDNKIYDMGDSTSPASNYGASLVWKKYDHVWNLDNVANSQKKTSGWIWPVVDYGKINDTDFSQPIDVRYQRPGFFLKTAIEEIIANAGYRIDTVRNSLASNPMYEKLIVQFANDSFDHGSDYQNSNDNESMTVSNKSGATFNKNTVDGNRTGVVPFAITSPTDDPGNHFKVEGRNHIYKADANVSVTITFSLSLRLTGAVLSRNGSAIKFVIRLGGDGETDLTELDFDLTDSPVITNAFPKTGYKDFFNQKMSYDIELAAGQSVLIAYILTNPNVTTVQMYADATFTVASNEQKVLFGHTVQCERIFPDISQKDLLKDNLQRFGLTCQTDMFNHTITFASFKDIVKNIPLAKDWTSKCLNQGKSVLFQLGGYGQVNYLRYKQDDSLTTVSAYTPNPIPKYYFDDQININDKTLDLTNDLFESQFGPSLNRPFYGGTIAKISKIDPTDDSDDFSIGTQPRILIDQKLDLKGKNVTFTDGTDNVVINDVISVPYFFKPDGEYSLSWKDIDAQKGLKSIYYPEIEKILTRTKKVTRYFILSAKDIYELDLLIPIYLQQDGCYYYVNKIDSWVKDQPCKVELVKLG